jgi:L-2,4-diaminobutyrate decarboxylase
MFWVAPPCGVLLVRRRRDLAYALAPGLAEASYVVPDQAALARLDADEDDLLHWTLATTRLCMGLKIYAALAVYGLSGLRHRIERLCELSRALHRLVSESPDFAALVEPEANIVCFRHRPPALAGDEPAIDVHNRRLRQAIARGPATYLTGVAIGGRYWLRATLMNENITAASLPALLAIVRETALSLTT